MKPTAEGVWSFFLDMALLKWPLLIYFSPLPPVPLNLEDLLQEKKKKAELWELVTKQSNGLGTTEKTRFSFDGIKIPSGFYYD